MPDGEQRRDLWEELRDESTAMICGYDTPCQQPIGRCCFCGGKVWPIEDECWDGATFHYITFAYKCYACGHFDAAARQERRVALERLEALTRKKPEPPPRPRSEDEPSPWLEEFEYIDWMITHR